MYLLRLNKKRREIARDCACLFIACKHFAMADCAVVFGIGRDFTMATWHSG